MTDSERRNNPRFEAGIEARVGFTPSWIVDLGYGGALVETSEYLLVGRQCTLKLADPPLRITATVARCRLSRIDAASGNAMYSVGLAFDDTPGLRERLEPLLSLLAWQPGLQAQVG